MPVRYVHLFEEGGRRCLLIDDFASGEFRRAQRVLDLTNGEVQVRKIEHPRLRLSQAQASPDPEIRIMQYLNANRPAGTSLPHIAELIRHSDFIWPQTQADTEPKVSRASHWKYYNGRDLDYFLETYRGLRPLECIPDAFIGRFAHQMLLALQFLYQLRVVHRDIHLGNIFLEYDTQRVDSIPNFYLGDFGEAQKVLLAPGIDNPVQLAGWFPAPTDLTPRYQISEDLRQLAEVVKLLARHGRLVEGTEDGNRVIEEHGVERAIELALLRCSPVIQGLLKLLNDAADAHEGPIGPPRIDPITGTQQPARRPLPGLRPMIRTIAEAIAAGRFASVLSTAWVRDVILDNLATLTPRFYRHPDNFWASRRRVLGPWYEARVDTETMHISDTDMEALDHERREGGDDDDDDYYADDDEDNDAESDE
ncbi:hypothetical protein GE09DRAFT_1230749 [Coniochaeta sp. 2T2.1]|nr:hypothetical protein GE09DRAFT_1230749 [Coniochaeta sp. 2T2.1]